MKKWGIFTGDDGRKYVSLIFTTEQEAELIPTIAEAVGNGYRLPIQVLNKNGVFQSFQYEDCGKIIESVERPELPFEEEWDVNPQEFSCGWVSPDGVCYGCWPYLLKDLTCQVALRIHGYATPNSRHHLLEKGWILVGEESPVKFNTWPEDVQFTSLVAYGLHQVCSESVFEIRNAKSNLDLMLHHTAFSKKVWYEELCNFLKYGYCNVEDQHVFELRDALARLNLHAHTKRIKKESRTELSGALR